jgi:hypothetical protein
LLWPDARPSPCRCQEGHDDDSSGTSGRGEQEGHDSDDSSGTSSPGDNRSANNPKTNPPVPRSTPEVAVPTCDGSPPISQPTEFLLACADANASVTDITWTSSTGATVVTGTGTFNLNQCQPNCALGSFTHTPATITLSNPTVSGIVFQSVTVVPTDGSAQYTVSQPGAWGVATG